MNQAQVKKALIGLKTSKKDFVVVLSGKTSKKVNGLYKPERCEILLHNKNFFNDNELMYTAIHEFTHHLLFSSSVVPLSTRTHTASFWALFHSLLNEAQKQKAYVSPFDTNREFVELTGEIREKVLSRNGWLMKELGRLLLQAQALCEKYHTSFSDYLDRILNLPRPSATTAIKAHSWNLDPRLGFDNMRTIARITDATKRRHAQEAFLKGWSPEQVKYELSSTEQEPQPLEKLLVEKDRITRSIKSLEVKLVEIERRIEERRIKGLRKTPAQGNNGEMIQE